MQVEVAVFNPQSALIAASAGADRLELCSALAGGGLTPSVGYLGFVRSKIEIPLHCLVRPREGDFCYNGSEFQVMARDILEAKNQGMQGVVFGLLLPDGKVDKVRTHQLVELAHPMTTTFHRAIDKSANILEALEDVIQCGCHSVLSSGGGQDVAAGLANLAQMQHQAGTRIHIIAGGGITLEIASGILDLGINYLHLSASGWQTGAMEYRKPHPDFGVSKPIPDFETLLPDPLLIQRIRSLG